MDTYQSLQQQNQAILIGKVVNISPFSLINTVSMIRPYKLLPRVSC